MSIDITPRDATSANSGRLAIIWLVNAITILSLCGRIYARYRRFKRLFWDDFFVVLAWAIAIPMAAQATISSSRDAAVGSHANRNVFLSKPVTQVLFYTSLWCVKVSFLIFFRSIGACKLQGLKRYWRCVVGLTIVAYLAIWAINPYECWARMGVLRCESEASVIAKRTVSFSVATVLIVVTDCLIIAIPFALLSNIKKISTRKKFILYTLFSVEIVTVIMSIVRCVIATRGLAGDKGLQIRVILLLTHIETNIAITVACVGSLRSLFTQDDRTKARAYDPPKLQTLRVSGHELARDESEAVTDISLESRERSNSMTVPLTRLSAVPSRAESFELSATSRS